IFNDGLGTVLCFRLPGHGDATLKSMNSLRSRQQFCDITIVASGRQTFRGHKVVLAACSPFLRDQFLLNPSSELQVGIRRRSLLQSCYTGVLQFSPKEIVNYLTAASYLQMEHVVEKCRGALGKYMQPKNPSSPKVSYLFWLPHSPMMQGFGLDFSQETMRSAFLSGGDLPRLDYGMGEVQGEELVPRDGNGQAHYNLDDPSGDGGEGNMGMAAVPTGGDGAGDESVAVVGSTSSTAGPVACEQCGLTFPLAHSLAVHTRATHLLYVCPCCGKHFNHSSNLNRHMTVHRGAKVHRCPLCDKTFTQKSTLCDHMNLHSGERPHCCAYCHSRFAHKPALRRHLKEQHGKTTAQNSLEAQAEMERVAGPGEGEGDTQDRFDF
uniref:Zinc finger and BTB domain containing 12 n=1 Tax=Oncorhynchus tshawytscha TaxID=74940 RepID=A0AAZ3SD18_ONCTS